MPVKELIKTRKDKILGFNPILFIFYKSNPLECSLSIFRVFSSILKLFCFESVLRLKSKFTDQAAVVFLVRVQINFIHYPEAMLL